MNKTVVGMTTLVIVAILFVVGFVVFGSITESISGPEASSNMNVTMAAGSTVYGVTGLVLIVGAISVICALGMYWVSSPSRFKVPNKLVQFLATTTLYFGYGALTIVLLAIPTYMLYFLFNYTIVEGNTGALIDIIKWSLIIIAVYFGIAGIGWISKKYFYNKLSERLKEKEYKENINELPKVVE